MTPRQKLTRKLERRGSELENQNYHDEASFFFDLAAAIAAGTIPFEGNDQLPGSPFMKLINFILKEDWA